MHLIFQLVADWAKSNIVLSRNDLSKYDTKYLSRMLIAQGHLYQDGLYRVYSIVLQYQGWYSIGIATFWKSNYTLYQNYTSYFGLEAKQT